MTRRHWVGVILGCLLLGIGLGLVGIHDVTVVAALCLTLIACVALVVSPR